MKKMLIALLAVGASASFTSAVASDSRYYSPPSCGTTGVICSSTGQFIGIVGGSRWKPTPPPVMPPPVVSPVPISPIYAIGTVLPAIPCNCSGSHRD